MLAKLIVPVLAAAALAGCASHDSEPAPIAVGRPVAAATAAPPGPVGFLGGDGPQVAATPEINRALETGVTGQPQSWTDADSGTVTQFTALRTFQRDDNTYCRDFSQTVTKGSSTESARGVACRDSDGTWRAVAG